MTDEQTTFETLAELIGKESALTLCEQFGGETIYIRKSVDMGDGVLRPWMEYLGIEAWDRLNSSLGGKRVYIPAAPAEMLAERNAAIVKRFEAGDSAAKIAVDFKLTPRSVYLIYQRHNAQ